MTHIENSFKENIIYIYMGQKTWVLSWASGIPTLQHLCLCPFPSTPVQLESHRHRPQRSQELRPLRLERPLDQELPGRHLNWTRPGWWSAVRPVGGIETTPPSWCYKKIVNDLTKPQCGWMMLKSEPTFFFHNCWIIMSPCNRATVTGLTASIHPSSNGEGSSLCMFLLLWLGQIEEYLSE